MNGPFRVAQANGATEHTGKPVRVVKVAKPFGEQSVIVALSYDGSVKADLSAISGENITLVHLGEKLIILFDNKSTVTLEPFFDSTGKPLGDITVEVAPGRDLTSAEFASLFPVSDDQSILPAAGDNGGNAQASGAYFTSVGVDPLSLPTPLPLLGQENLPGFTIENRLATLFINDLPTVSANTAVSLDEDGLPGGNLGGLGDFNPATNGPISATGVLSHDYHFDGAGSTLLLGTGAPSGFTYALSSDGTVLTVSQIQNNVSVDVIRITLSNTVDGAYTITQLHAIDHVPGGNENDQAFVFNYRVTDSNGDSVDGTLSLTVNDDSPTVSANSPVALDEDALPGGNLGGIGDLDPSTNGPITATGTLSHSYGADGAGTVLLAATGAPEGFTYAVSGDGTVLTVSQIQNGVSVSVLQIVLADRTSGDYTVTQLHAINHAPGQDENTQAFTFNYNVTDHDGDVAGGTLQVTVNDDTPVALPGKEDGEEGQGAFAILYEDGLTDANSDHQSIGNPDGGSQPTSAVIHAADLQSLVSFGADQPGKFSLNHSATAPALSSHGDPVTYSVVGDTLIATAGQRTVFTLHDNGDQTFTFVLKDQLDHFPGSGDFGTLTINLASAFVATDSDGDSVVLDGTFNIRVENDVPVTQANTPITVDEDDLASGNHDSAPGDDNGSPSPVTGTLHFSVGADEPGTVDFASLSGKDVVDTGSNAVKAEGQTLHYFWDASSHTLYASTDVANAGTAEATAAFRITITDPSTGAYSFSLLGPLDHPSHTDPANPASTGYEDNINIDLTYTVTDFDKDTATGTLSVSIDDDMPVLTGKIAASSVNENDIFTLWSQGTSPFDGHTEIGTGAAIASGNLSTLVAPGADTPVTWGFVSDSQAIAYMESLGLYSKQTALPDNGQSLTYSVTHVGNDVVLSAFEPSTPGIPGSGNIVFSFTLDSQNGNYTFRLFDELIHVAGDGTNTDLRSGAPGAGPDGTQASIPYIDFGSIITATDADGDSVTLTNKVQVTVFDDVPQVHIGVNPLGEVQHDETPGVQSPSFFGDIYDSDTNSSAVKAMFAALESTGQTGDDPDVAGTGAIGYAQSVFAVVFNATIAYGADFPPEAVVFSLHVNDGVFSGVKTTEGANIYLYNENGLIVGRVGRDSDATADQPNANGTIAFAIAIEQDGKVDLAQYLSLHHPNANNSDDSISLADGAVQAVLTVTDSDGDAVSDSADISAHIRFDDDGPSVTIIASGATVAHDETAGVQTAADPNASNDVHGSDLPAAILALFNGITNRGFDSDLTSHDNGAIGFAHSSGSLVNVTPDFGADGAAATNSQVLSLVLDGRSGRVDSGLTTTDGHKIYLTLENGLIVGRVDTNGDHKVSDSDPAAFAIAIEQDGTVDLAQYLSLHNPTPGSSYDEAVALKSGAVKVEVTVTDGDGDHVTSKATDISSHIQFQDDGPTLTVTTPDSVNNSFFFDGFVENGNAWGTGSGIATGTAGSWAIANSDDGQGGNGAIQLERVGDGYQGMHTSTHGFMVDLDATAHDVKISQTVAGLTNGESYALTFEAGAPFPNSAHLEVWFGGQKVFDLDPTGAMQTYTLELFGGSGNGSNLLEFRETGTPDNQGTYVANVRMADVIVIDETPGVDADSNDTISAAVAAQFNGIVNVGTDVAMGSPQFATGSAAAVHVTPDFGADGPKDSDHNGVADVDAIVYALSTTNNVDSGLMTTAGQAIHLFLENGIVVGRYDSDNNGSYDTAALAFAINSATGVVSVAQYVSLQHPDHSSSDEGIYLNAGTLGVTVTITDGDGDKATQGTDVSASIRFEDDGPTIDPSQNSSLRDWTLDEDVLAGGNDSHDTPPDSNDYTLIANKDLGVHWGADGAGTLTIAASDAQHPTIAITDQNGAPIGTPLTSGGVALTYNIVTNADGGQTLTATAGANTVFTLTLDPDAGPNGTFSFNLLGHLDHPAGDGQNQLDLNFGFTATDGDHDSVSSNIVVRITDDVPYAVGDNHTYTVDEDDTLVVQWNQQSIGTSPNDGNGDGSYTGSPPSNVFGPAVVSGHLASSVSFGADGERGFGFASSAATSLAALGLTSQGDAIRYTQSGNALLAYVDQFGQNHHYDAGVDRTIFTLTLDPTSGDFQFKLYDQLDHVQGDGENTDLQGAHGAVSGLDFGSLIVATDGDGDSIALGGKLTIQITDDTPQILAFDATGVSVTVDETGGAHDNNVTGPVATYLVASQFQDVAHVGHDADMGNKPVYAANILPVVTGGFVPGADEPASYQLSLQINGQPSANGGIDSGLRTTDGHEIYLFNENGIVVGRIDGDNDGVIGTNGSEHDVAAFAITINKLGEISIAQYLSLHHDNPANPDDTQTLADNLISAKLTVTDSDGDSVSQTVDIGGAIHFDDDGPHASLVSTQSALTIDETAGNDAQTNDVSTTSSLLALFDAAWGTPIQMAQSGAALVSAAGSTFGADGQGPANLFGLAVVNGVDSGLNATDGRSIYLYQDGSLIVGREGDSGTDAKNPNGDVAFAIAIDPFTGQTTVAEYIAIQHPDHNDPNEAASPQTIADNALRATVTITDGDGDTSVASVGIGSQIEFRDDGPSVAAAPLNQIVNGDFSQGVWSAPDWWGSSSTNVTGWSLAASPVGPGTVDLERVPDGIYGMHSSTHGTMIDMGSSPGNMEITQSFTPGTLVAGQTYAIQFEAGAPFPETAKLEVLWDGQVIGTIDPSGPGTLTSYNYIVTANGTSDALTFREVGTGDAPIPGTWNGHSLATEGYHGTYLANVGLVATYVVDEDGLPAGNHDLPAPSEGDVPGLATSVVGDLHINWGADNYDSATLDSADANRFYQDNNAGTLIGRNVTFTDADVSVSGGTSSTSLTSHGDQVILGLDSSGTHLVGTATHNGVTREVFEVSLSDDGTGAFKFTLHDALDHAPNGSENDIDLTFNFTATDSDGDSARGTFTVGIDDDMPVVSNPNGVAPGVSNAIVSESDIVGIAGEQPAGTAVGVHAPTAAGNLLVDFGADGFGSTAFTGAFSVPNAGSGTLVAGGAGVDSGLTSDHREVLFRLSPDGRTIEGYTASDGTHPDEVVLQANLNANDAGWTVTLLGNIDHQPPDGVPGGRDEGQSINFTVAATDADGDSIDVTLSTRILDDAPTAAYSGRVTVQETADAAGNFVPQTATGHFVFDGGADGATVTSVDYGFAAGSGGEERINDPDAPTGGDLPFPLVDLTSGGQAITIAHGANPLELIGTRADGTKVFELDVTDPTTGAYSFTQFAAIDHPDQGQSGAADPLRMKIGFTVTDGDGDTASNSIQVDILDDAPTAAYSGRITLQETADSTSHFVPQTATGHFVFDGGADGAKVTSVGYGLTGGVINDPDASQDAGHDVGFVTLPLTSNGQAITFSHPGGDPLELIGTRTDGTRVFELDVTDPATGAYSFTQFAAIDHPDQGQSGAADPLRMAIDFTVTDGDGDTAGGHIQVDILDDAPTVTAVGDAVSVDEANLPSDAHPTPLPGFIGTAQAATGFLHIDWGADNGAAKHLAFVKDGQGHVVGPTLSSDGVPLEYVVRFPGDSPGNEQIVAYKQGGNPDSDPVFSITLYEQGNGYYTYIQYQNIDHSAQGTDLDVLNFNVIATDSDGDSVPTSFTVNVTDDVPHPAVADTATPLIVDETAGLDSGTNDVASSSTLLGLFDAAWGAPIQIAQSGNAMFSTAGSAFGADGQGAASVFGLNVVDGTNSGLNATDGRSIYLFKEGNLIVGREGDAGTDVMNANGPVAFAISIDAATGQITLAEYTAIQHPDHSDPNEASTPQAIANGAIEVSYAMTDGDHDTTVATADIGSLIQFRDDGPSISAQSNLIINGSFEQGHDDLGNGQWSIYHSLPGWTTADVGPSGPAGDIPFEVQVGGPAGVAAQDGNALIELDSDFGTGNVAPDANNHFNDSGHTNATIQQVIAGSESGQTYELTFWYAPRPNEGNADSGSMNVLWNGAVVKTIDSTGMTPGVWQQITVFVEGTGSGHDTLAFQATGQENSLGALIDNVSLVAAVAVDEDGLNGPNAVGHHDSQPGDIVVPNADGDNNEATATGLLGINWGADSYDGAADTHVGGDAAQAFVQDGSGRSVTFTNTTVGIVGGTLTSHGDAVTLSLSADGTVLTGTAQHGSDAPRTVFEVSLSDDNSGAFRFILKDALDHAAGQNENNLTLSFNYTATDSDGDHAAGTFQVLVNDDMPVVTGVSQAHAVYEGELAEGTVVATTQSHGDDLNGDGNGNDSYFTGNLTSLVSFGADGPGAYIVDATHLAPELLSLTSGGVGLSYSIAADNTLVAKANGVEIFEFQVDPTTGQYSFRLEGPLDHIGSGHDAALTLDMSTAVTARDADGDTVALGGHIFITVNDDTPTARADDGNVTEGALLQVTAENGVLLNDVPGADGYAAGGAVVGVAAGNNVASPVSGHVGVDVDGAHGTLHLNSDGSYTYQSTANDITADATDTFVYTIEDGDGDRSTTTLTIHLGDVTLTADNQTQTVYEKALDTVMTSPDLGAGTVTGSDPTDTHETVTGQLAVAGAIGYAPIDQTTANGIFHLAADGSYTYTLTSPYSETPVDNGTDTVYGAETFSYTAQDSNGNTVGGTVKIDIVDDVPHADPLATQDIAEAAIANGTLHFTGGADGAAVTQVNGVDLIFGGDGYSQVFHNLHGDLQVKSDGTYKFVAQTDDVYNNGGAVFFDYTVTDGDGDTSTAQGAFDVTDTPTPVTVSLSASTTNEDAVDTSYVFTATLSAQSHGATTVHTTLGDITIADGQTTGELVIPSNNGPDVYVDASSLTNAITSATGGNFEQINPDTTSVTATVTDTTNTVTATLTAGDAVYGTSGVTIAYTVTLTSNDGLSPIGPTDNLLSFTLASGEVIHVAQGATSGTVDVTYGYGTFGSTITNSITGKTGDGEYENLVTTGSPLTDANTVPTGGGSVSLTLSEAALDMALDPADLHAGAVNGSDPSSAGETSQATSGISFAATGEDLTLAFDPTAMPTVTGLANGYTLSWSLSGSGELIGNLKSPSNVDLGAFVYLALDTTSAAAGTSVTPTITATLVDNLLHSAGTDPVTIDGLQVVATDTSGDQIAGAVNLTINDDAPVIHSIQDAIVANTDGMAVGNIDVDFGADGSNSASPATVAVTTQSGVVDTNAGLVITSWDDLQGVTESLSADGKTLTATVDATHQVFYTLTVDDAAHDYTLTYHERPVVSEPISFADQTGGSSVPTITEAAGDVSVTFDGGVFANGVLTNPNNSTDALKPTGNGFGVGSPGIENDEGFFVTVSHNGQSTTADSLSFSLERNGGGGGGTHSVTLHWIAYDENGQAISGGAGSGSQVVDLGGSGTIHPVTINPPEDFSKIAIWFDNETGANSVGITNFSLGTSVIPEDQPLHFGISAVDGDGDVTGAATLDALLSGGAGPGYTLTGTNASEVLVGGPGNDIIIGGGGVDKLTGGTGADHFRFNGLSELGDHITDFSGSSAGGDHDLIDLLATAFGGGSGPIANNDLIQVAAGKDFTATSGATAVDMGTAHFAYQQTTGELFYDANGGGADASRILLAVFDNHAAIAATDIHKV